MALELTPIRTPATAQQIYSAIKAQWPSSVGGTPNHTAIVIMVAQISLETDDSSPHPNFKSMWNNNPGNIAGKGGDYVMLRAYTGVRRPYRAFPTLDAGVSAYLGLLEARYAAAIQAALQGDLAGFAAALKARGYYEETEASYLAGLQSRYAPLAASLANYDGGDPEPAPIQPVPEQPSIVKSVVVALLGGAAIGTAAHFLVPAERKLVRRRRLRYA